MPPPPLHESISDSREQQQTMAQQVSTFGASLSYRLAAYANTADASGSRELWRTLSGAYSGQPGALEQLPLLFCLQNLERSVKTIGSGCFGRPASFSWARHKWRFGTPRISRVRASRQRSALPSTFRTRR